MATYDKLDASNKREFDKLVYSHLVHRRELNRISHAFTVPYNLSDKDISILSTILQRYIVIDPNVNKHSNHPIAASLNYFANQKAIEEASKYPRYFDIGSDARIPCPHHCNLVNNHRDAYRYLMQSDHLQNKSFGENIRESVQNHKNTENFCVDGAENCRYEAECAISCNSLYDIPIENIMKIFESHKLQILIAWMYLPLSLIDNDLCGVNEEAFKTYVDKGKMYFRFCNDMSFIYVHDVENWRKYLTTTLIQGEEFDIVIEINQTYGALNKLYFRKVPKYDLKLLPRVLPLADYYHEYVKIPNMRFVAAADFNAEFSCVPKLVVKRNVAERMYAFVYKSPDTQLNYERAASYFQGLNSRIVIANQVVNDESFLPIDDFDDVLFSIVVIAAISRHRRNKTLAKVMKMNDYNFEYHLKHFAIFPKFLQWCKQKYDIFMTPKVNGRYEYNKSTDHMMFMFEYINNLEVADVIKIGRCCGSHKDDKTFAWHHPYKNQSIQTENSSTDFGGQSEPQHNGNSLPSGKPYEPSLGGTPPPSTSTSSTTLNTIGTFDDEGKTLDAMRANLLSLNDNHVLEPIISPLQYNIDEQTLLRNLCSVDLPVNINSPSVPSALQATHVAEPFQPNIEVPVVVHLDPIAEELGIVQSDHAVRGSYKVRCDVNAARAGMHNSNESLSTIATFNAKINLPKYQQTIGCSDEIEFKSQLLSQDDQRYAAIRSVESTINHPCVDKFLDIRNHISESVWLYNESYLEVGVAPGHVWKYCTKNKIFNRMAGVHYIGPGAVNLHTQLEDDERIVRVEDLSQIKFTRKYRYVFCDACDETHSLQPVFLYALLSKFLHKTGVLVIKTFYDLIDDKMACVNKFHTFYKPVGSLSVNKEVYMIITNSSCKVPLNYEMVRTHFQLSHLSALIYYTSTPVSDFNSFHKFQSGDVVFTDKEYVLKYEDQKNFEFEFDNQDDEKFQKLASDFKVKSLKIEHTDVMLKIKIANGVAGSGKTRHIQDTYENRFWPMVHDVILVNTRALKQIYRSKGFHNVHTYYSGLMKGRTFRHVFIDEVFEINLAYLYYFLKFNTVRGQIFGYGDQSQIGKIDFKKCCYNPASDFGEIPCTNFVSMRVPQDVCRVLSNACGYQCFTTNTKKFSITFVDDVDLYVNKFDVPIQVFSQKSKMVYSQLYPNRTIKTIHEMKGSTVRDLVWIISHSESSALSNSIEHIIVACTRHTNSLVIYDQSAFVKKTILMIADNPIQMCIERFTIPLLDTYYYNNRPLCEIVTVDEQPLYLNLQIRPDDILPSLDHLINLYCLESEYSFVRRLNMPGIKQGSAILNQQFCDNLEYVVKGRCLVNSTVARRYDSKDKFMTAATLFGRYGKETRTYIKDHLFEYHLHNLRDGLNKFLRFPIGSNAFIKHFYATDEEVSKYLVEYIESLNRKNCNIDDFVEVTEPLFDTTFRMIKFFMKRQTKYDSSFEAIIREKFGQGVNSWDKIMNVAFSAYSRLISDRMRTMLKPNCLYSIGLTEDKIGDAAAFFIQQYINKFGLQPNYVENDFTEYDSSQSELTIYFESDIIMLVSHNQELVDLYKEHRTRWKTTTPGLLMMKGYAKKHSGEPFTIDFNTLINIALCGTLYEIDDLACALFKGDDSLLIGGDIHLTRLGNQKLLEFGFETKVAHKNVGEFTGFIVSECGFYPDYIRRFVKAVSKCYQDPEDFEEMKNAIRDYVNVVKSLRCQTSGRIKLVAYYNEIIAARFPGRKNLHYITDELIQKIESFMCFFGDIDYFGLCKYDQIGLNFPCCGGISSSVGSFGSFQSEDYYA